MRQCLTWQCFLCPRSSCLRPGVDIVLTGKGLSSSNEKKNTALLLSLCSYTSLSTGQGGHSSQRTYLSTAFLLPSPVWLYKKHCLFFYHSASNTHLLSTTHASSRTSIYHLHYGALGVILEGCYTNRRFNVQVAYSRILSVFESRFIFHFSGY